MKLKTLLSAHSLSQADLARILQRDKSVVTNILQGKRRLKADEAALIAQVLSVPVAELLGLEEAQPGVSETCLIPFQHAPTHARGAKQVVQQDGKYYIEESGYYSNKAYALEVRDASLNLSGVLPGDVIISELDHPCRAGQIVVAQHYAAGGAETLIRKYQPPFLLPHSTDPAFAPLSLDSEDIRVVSPVLKLVRLL